MADGSAGLGLAPPNLNGTKAKPVANAKKGNDVHSDTLSTVSEDTPEPPASPPSNWQSSILGNTIEAKKARKKERHERHLAQADEKAKKRAARKEAEARRAEREERRQQKAAQETKRASDSTAVLPTEDPDVKLAEAAGLSLKKYKKKMAKGLIKINEDGTPAVVKKEKKDKAAEPVTPESSGKKRKHEDSVEKLEKKKKKKSKN